MNSPKPRLAAHSDRARLPRLSRAELERLLVRARRAFEAFGASAGPAEAEGDEERFSSTRPAATVKPSKLLPSVALR